MPPRSALAAPDRADAREYNARFSFLDASLHRNMRALAFTLFLLIFAGCDTGIVVHDEARAAELIVDFLTALKTDEGIELSYAWTDERFKQDVSASEFAQLVALIRNKNMGATIQLQGYEVFGPVELINLYANSETSSGKIYFRFVLVGARSSDYYLLNLDIDESDFKKEGVFREYQQSISVKGL